MTLIPMLPQFYIGEGVNSSSGQVFGQAIDFSSIQPPETGQRTDFFLESVSSSRELGEKLDIGVSASLQLGLFGASAEFKFTNSESINNYYVYALVRVVVQNPPQLIRNPVFRPYAIDLLKNQGWDAFAKAHGWEYIQGVVTGGTYYGLIEIQTSTEEEQKDVRAKLSVSYGPFKAQGSLENTLRDIVKNTVTRVIVHQSAGRDDTVETSLDDMINQAKHFPQIVSANPVAIVALTADYRSTVPIPPGVPEPDSLARLNQRDVLQDLGREYMSLRDYKHTLEFILEQQRLTDFDDFREMSPTEIEAARQRYRDSLRQTAAELDRIVDKAERCAENCNQCETFTPAVQRLALPRKGGELMNLKELEDKVQQLGNQLTGTTQLLTQQIGTTGRGIDEITSGQRALQNASLVNGATIRGAGRLHVAGEELLYLLNKSGVIIGREWGGSGDLFVEGTTRLGVRHTPIRNLQCGSVGVGNSSGRVKHVTVPFGTPFEGVPNVVTVVRGDGRRDLPDTLAVNVTDVNPGEFAANICRVDAISGWGQAVSLSWIAWE